MKHAVLLLLLLIIRQADGMTVEEFHAAPPAQRIKILSGKPDRMLDDPSKILQIYTAALRDPSADVRKVAAKASALLVSGIQAATPGGNVPAFPEEDSRAFQLALVQALNSEEPRNREFTAIALANSAAPNPALEALLLERARVEQVPEIKASVLEAMAQTGYQSPRIASEATTLLQSSTDTKAIYSASKVLGHLRAESALNTLVALASKVSPSQRHALQALAAYGQAATRAVPMLERLVTDQAMPEDIRNLAGVTLEAVKTGNPQPSALQPMKPVNLWPIALSPASPAQPSTPAPVQPPAPAPPVATATPAPSSPAPTVAESPAPVVEHKSKLWLWVVGIAALIAIVVFIVKCRG